MGHSRKPCRLRPRQDTEWFATPVGGLRRQGRWRLARHTVCVTLLGGMRLDLRQAELSGPDTMVTAVMLVGGARVSVPAGLNGQVSGFTLPSGRRIDDDQAAAPDAPVLRLRVLSHKPTHIGLPQKIPLSHGSGSAREGETRGTPGVVSSSRVSGPRRPAKACVAAAPPKPSAR